MQPWFLAFAETIADGEPFYLACVDCEFVGLPPRTVCPECGTQTLEQQPLSGPAEVVSYTEIHSTIPDFADETPYEVVLATFEPGVRLTGQLRGDSVSVGDQVTLDAEERGDGWLLTFTPA